MSAIKDKQRGTWSAKFYNKDPVTGELKQVLKRGFATKREALAWESSQKAQTGHTSITFKELDNLYIAYKNPRKQSTKEQEQHRVDAYVSFADMQVSGISKQTLLNWYVDFINNDLATSTKNNVIGIVKSCLKFGADVYGLPNNSAVLKKLKREKKRKINPTWTVEEFQRFARCVPSPYKEYFTFLYCTGLRRGEAMALQVSDFNGDTVSVTKQIKYANRGFEPLKTSSSERTLKLPQSVQTLVKPLLNGSGYVFGGDAPLPITNIQRHFTNGIKQSGVKKIRIHDLRHSFATNAINNGCNIVAVSKYLGHSTIQQTLETYTHLLEKTDDEMVAKMETVVSNLMLP